MYTMHKRGIIVAMALIILAASMIVPTRKIEAATTYNNTTRASADPSVSSYGQLDVALSVDGIKGKANRIEVELYVEKRFLGVFWSKVNIGYPNNIWTDAVNNYMYRNTFSTQLPSSGTFRVTVTYTVSGTGGADDVITFTGTVSC